MLRSKLGAAKVALAAAAVAGGWTLVAGQAMAAATIVINNINAPGVGFNDPTPAAPVGGNPGTTLGQQRLLAFERAAEIWAQTLTSDIPIFINAQMTALTCTATTAVLGSAGATSIFRDNASFPKAGTWYSYALANKLAGVYLGTLNAPQLNANFNVNLGQPTCLPGSPWYFGFDNNHGTAINFVTVVLHEIGHGVGFQTFTNGSSGAQNGGFPSIWDHFLRGTSTGLLWKDMTNAQRQASAISVNGLVWDGATVTAAIPGVLRQGLPNLNISGPAAGANAGNHPAGEAAFGPELTQAGFTGTVMPVVNANGTLSEACNPITGAAAASVNNNIALVVRGTCAFVIKVANLQAAGAKGVMIANNTTGIQPPGGADPTITIPTIGITQALGNSLLEALKTRSRTGSGVVATLGLAGTQFAGTDALGRALMFAPNPFQGGSSVSHYDTSMTRNQLMEPSINSNLTHSLLPPEDLTFRLLQDTGW